MNGHCCATHSDLQKQESQQEILLLIVENKTKLLCSGSTHQLSDLMSSTGVCQHDLKWLPSKHM